MVPAAVCLLKTSGVMAWIPTIVRGGGSSHAVRRPKDGPTAAGILASATPKEKSLVAGGVTESIPTIVGGGGSSYAVCRPNDGPTAAGIPPHPKRNLWCRRGDGVDSYHCRRPPQQQCCLPSERWSYRRRHSATPKEKSLVAGGVTESIPTIVRGHGSSNAVCRPNDGPTAAGIRPHPRRKLWWPAG